MTTLESNDKPRWDDLERIETELRERLNRYIPRRSHAINIPPEEVALEEEIIELFCDALVASNDELSAVFYRNMKGRERVSIKRILHAIPTRLVSRLHKLQKEQSQTSVEIADSTRERVDDLDLPK